MIKVAGSEIDIDGIIESYPRNSIKRDIAKILSTSVRIFKYDSAEQLKFEIDVRNNTVSAARELNKSKFSFEVFRDSKCNEEYWDRTLEGGFRLKDGVKSSEAIRDIYVHSSKYANECATAMVIVFYKAVLDTFPEERFNRLFSKIYLMNWTYLDRKLALERFINVTDNLPGDCRYFKNPDVDPSTPEWQGENTIYLGDGLFYGHGVGILPDAGIIRALNRRRREGATVSAYLLDQSTNLGYKYLYSLLS